MKLQFSSVQQWLELENKFGDSYRLVPTNWSSELDRLAGVIQLTTSLGNPTEMLYTQESMARAMCDRMLTSFAAPSHVRLLCCSCVCAPPLNHDPHWFTVGNVSCVLPLDSGD